LGAQKNRPERAVVRTVCHSGFGRFAGHARLARGFAAFHVGFAATAFFGLVALSSHINLYKRALFRLCSGTMDFASNRFNTYLLAALAACLLCACASAKHKKMNAVLRVHPEATENTTFTKTVSVFRDHPVEIKVDQSPLLTEDEVASAQVVNALGGFALVIKFNPRGQWLLDQHSSLHRGKHLAIFVEFGEKPGIHRWIAAPILSNRISDGTLIFTPDATREEAEEFASTLVIEKQPEDNVKVLK
jgi:hypothetical protein